MTESLEEWAGAGTDNQVLLLTDFMNSTAIGKKLGDEKWIEILIKHFERARELLDQYKGYEIKLIGDAYMAAFHTAGDALGFAKSFFVDSGHIQIIIRVAIHVGRVLIVDNDIYGLSVNYTARMLSSVSGPGIVLSDPAKRQVVDALDERVLPDFKKELISMKSFGLETLWRYQPEEMIREFKESHGYIART